MRGLAYATLGIVQGFSLGLAQSDGRWIIFALVILSILLMLAYLMGDALRDIQEWRQDPEKVAAYLYSIGMGHLVPTFLAPDKDK
jgi:hypothetical protein